ncbi:hypothetical protein R1sor_022421 [Riccia sorocarpa]|uniref:Uncharacterized protein n=1 Tax=Riccia sorocarpa TaxID=122646 RepID=A0ABD3GN45_9MARC
MFCPGRDDCGHHLESGKKEEHDSVRKEEDEFLLLGPIIVEFPLNTVLQIPKGTTFIGKAGYELDHLEEEVLKKYLLIPPETWTESDRSEVVIEGIEGLWNGLRAESTEEESELLREIVEREGLLSEKDIDRTSSDSCNWIQFELLPTLRRIDSSLMAPRKPKGKTYPYPQIRMADVKFFEEEIKKKKLTFLLWDWAQCSPQITNELTDPNFKPDPNSLRAQPEKWTVGHWRTVLGECAGKEGGDTFDTKWRRTAYARDIVASKFISKKSPTNGWTTAHLRDPFERTVMLALMALFRPHRTTYLSQPQVLLFHHACIGKADRIDWAQMFHDTVQFSIEQSRTLDVGTFYFPLFVRHFYQGLGLLNPIEAASFPSHFPKPEKFEDVMFKKRFQQVKEMVTRYRETGDPGVKVPEDQKQKPNSTPVKKGAKRKRSPVQQEEEEEEDEESGQKTDPEDFTSEEESSEEEGDNAPLRQPQVPAAAKNPASSSAPNTPIPPKSPQREDEPSKSPAKPSKPLDSEDTQMKDQTDPIRVTEKEQEVIEEIVVTGWESQGDIAQTSGWDSAPGQSSEWARSPRNEEGEQKAKSPIEQQEAVEIIADKPETSEGHPEKPECQYDFRSFKEILNDDVLPAMEYAQRIARQVLGPNWKPNMGILPVLQCAYQKMKGSEFKKPADVTPVDTTKTLESDLMQLKGEFEKMKAELEAKNQRISTVELELQDQQERNREMAEQMKTQGEGFLKERKELQNRLDQANAQLAVIQSTEILTKEAMENLRLEVQKCHAESQKAKSALSMANMAVVSRENQLKQAKELNRRLEGEITTKVDECCELITREITRFFSVTMDQAEAAALEELRNIIKEEGRHPESEEILEHFDYMNSEIGRAKIETEMTLQGLIRQVQELKAKPVPVATSEIVAVGENSKENPIPL